MLRGDYTICGEIRSFDLSQIDKDGNALLEESFWQTVTSTMFDTDRWESAGDDVANLINLTKVAPAAVVLDVACGPGRHSQAFAARGHKVMGIDLMASFIDAARAACSEFGDRTEFLCIDAECFTREAQFDLALSLFNSLGYRSRASDAHVLDNIFRSLLPRGILAVSLMTWEIVVRRFRSPTIRRHATGIVRRVSRLSETSRVLTQEWEFTDSEGTRRFVSHQHLYTAEEISERVSTAGFKDCAQFQDFKGTPYGAGADALVLIAHKGEGRAKLGPAGW